MDLASATDQLYAGSPDDFVERRKALIADARAAKDRTLATAIGKLRRPTRSAWLVNLYGREAPDELAALLDLGAALQAAQTQLSGPELRRLSGERQKTLAAATRSAVALGETHGFSATEAVRQEVTQTLQAALADPEVAGQVRAGTLTQAHTYGGFGPFTADVSAPAAAPATTGSDDAAEEEQIAADEEHDAAEQERRAEAEQRLHDAEEALSSAADEADRATERADQLADRVEELRSELGAAEAAEAEARQQARMARKRVTELEQSAHAAREAATRIPRRSPLRDGGRRSG